PVVFASTKRGILIRCRAPWHTSRRSVSLSRSNRPPHWTPPSIFRPPEALSEAEVIEAEAELKALQRHALELVDPEA
ncbi:MAG: hypothetical protein WBY67_10715, partial [Pseudolabrys sp.]